MQLLLIPLDDSILFPGMTVTIAADVGDAERVFVLPRHDGEYANDRHRRRGRRQRPPARRASTRSPSPACTAAAPAPPRPAPNGELTIEVEKLPDATPDGDRDPRARARVPRRGRGDPRAARRRRPRRRLPALDLRARARSPTPPATAPTSRSSDKQRLLETVDVTERLELALELQRERLAELQVRKRIRDDVEDGANAQQREYFLRKQMESIRKELGEDDASVVEEYETQDRRGRRCPTRSREQAERELGRLERMGEQTRRVLDDPHLPRLAARRAVGRALRRAARPGRAPARCSTPTTPASRTSRTGSPSTSPSAACAASAASSTRAGAPARSSP